MEKKDKDILEEIGNRNPFTVPENYFKDFSKKIDTQIGNINIKPTHMLKPWLYMAAMFVGIFILGNVFYLLYRQHQEQRDAVDLYEYYVSSQIDSSILIDFYAVDNGDNGDN